MAKRDTVSVNCEKVSSFIKMNEWTKAAFSRKVGKYSSWFAEVLRGNNLPSPEEAARMCVLLQTTPEEILSEEADIELVRSLIEQEREKGIKKERPADGEAPDQDMLLEIVRDSQDMSFLLKVMDEVNKSIQKLQ